MVVFVYTNSELAERENFFKSHLQLQKNKIPSNKYNQGGERNEHENYKTLLKEIEEKWKNIPC